jgi:hypothetical protein
MRREPGTCFQEARRAVVVSACPSSFTFHLIRIVNYISSPDWRAFSSLSLRQRARLLARISIHFLGFCFLTASCRRLITYHLNVCSRKPRQTRSLFRCEAPFVTTLPLNVKPHRRRAWRSNGRHRVRKRSNRVLAIASPRLLDASAAIHGLMHTNMFMRGHDADATFLAVSCCLPVFYRNSKTDRGRASTTTTTTTTHHQKVDSRLDGKFFFVSCGDPELWHANCADHHPIRIRDERERLLAATPMTTKSWGPSWGKQLPENGLVKPPRRDTRALSLAGMFLGKAPLRLAAQKSRPHAPSVHMRSTPAYFLCKWEYKLD